ncbi:hypothetical protein Tco_0785155 [Tanacetum coccineum]
MDQDSAHMVAASKVPMLKPENGATLPKTTTVEGVMTVMPITSAEEKAQRRLEGLDRFPLLLRSPTVTDQMAHYVAPVAFGSTWTIMMIVAFRTQRLGPAIIFLLPVPCSVIFASILPLVRLLLVLIVLGSVIQLPLVLSLAFGKSADLFVRIFLKLHYWTLTLEVSQTPTLITGVSSLIPSSSRIPTLPGYVANLLAIPALYSTLPIVVTFPLSLAEEGPNYALMAFSSSSHDSEFCLSTRNSMPLTPDLSFTGLDEFVNEPIVENSKAMSSKKEPKVVRKNDDAPCIEE